MTAMRQNDTTFYTSQLCCHDCDVVDFEQPGVTDVVFDHNHPGQSSPVANFTLPFRTQFFGREIDSVKIFPDGFISTGDCSSGMTH